MNKTNKGAVKPFRFSEDQHLAAYKATKALNGMEYIKEMYEQWYIDKMEALIAQEK